MLDWYFDCDGEQHSLRESLKQRPPASGAAAAAAAPIQRNQKFKLERYVLPGTSPPRPGECYVRFRTLLDAFRGKIQKLAEKYCQDDSSRGADAFDESIIWERSKEYALDASADPNVWLALSRLEDGFRKPVAVKKNDGEHDVERLQRIMRKLRPGSFIASAERLTLDFSEPTQSREEAPARASTPRGMPQARWVSEAGVCTLEELFGRTLDSKDRIERNTKAHRMLVREILLSMALAVFHLHECKIAHNVISLKFFKVFLIEEPPRSTNLRVKLVSMRKAETLSDVGERKDIVGLGQAMARVVLGHVTDGASIDYDELKSYDPSLYWLVTWILQDPPDGAKLADVIRHPYFTSLNEKEVLTLALEGDIFGQIITAAEVRCALRLLLHLQPLDFMLLTMLPVAASLMFFILLPS